ncbi:hypothetical protein PHMEG_00021610 [Phytophthora megakarya]|uniref:Uncharacterized protein n=1 Tax=Phytophthora megakarya TaxID=4795 RepID=A0A225VL67_9STRA|nr:hypothetical protein PHMEG_00021610 [Phytophthora megakarya]
MMAWPEEPRNGNGEWPDAELLESANFYPPDGDERAQHGANNFLSTIQSQGGPAGLTYSASCPSFSGLDGADDLMADVGSNSLLPFPFGSQEPLIDALEPVDNTPFHGDKNYNLLMQFQQEYQDSTQRQFPHQQVMGQSMVQQQIPGGRRGFHGSQSFTSLSTMESEYNRMNANMKRKKGNERWMKLQRHKSFDSSTPVTGACSLDPSTTFDNLLSMSNSTSDQLLLEPPDNDMVGFGVDDFSSSIQLNTPSWSPALSDASGDMTASSSTDVDPVSELDMLLSENERANLFDAIRDFESPEQTSAPFRAEVKSRVEKRVTAAAGQDLLQHMQKKTRLRSLDDLRSEARTVVLGEMERELHLHMQAYNWANSTSGGNLPEGPPQLPPYLLNFSVAGFGAFQAQQAAFHAAITTGSSLPPAAPSTSPPVGIRRSGSAKLAPSGSPPKVPAREK